MSGSWLNTLKHYVEKKPIAIIRFENDEWESLLESAGSVSEFTIARLHRLFHKISPPAICLLIGHNKYSTHFPSGPDIRIGILTSRSAVSTLETRVKIKYSAAISPKSEKDLLELISKKPYLTALKTKLKTDQAVASLSPKLSSHLIERLASVDLNDTALRKIASLISLPRKFKTNKSVQMDALNTALHTFGLSLDTKADHLELSDRETALDRVNIREDAVIEHDARHIPGYKLEHSDVTGRAIFTYNGEQLEVYTANRGDLEKALGVDLIYLNLKHQNIVLLQYKMLERHPVQGEVEWRYTPDSKLKEQIEKMESFSKQQPSGKYEYRLNPDAFYLKFVKRDGAIYKGGIMMPIAHYKRHIKNPISRGPKGSARISYDSLNGCYLRQTAFIDLLRSGYIGAYAATTGNFRKLIETVLGSHRAAVAVIHSVKAHIDKT